MRSALRCDIGGHFIDDPSTIVAEGLQLLIRFVEDELFLMSVNGTDSFDEREALLPAACRLRDEILIRSESQARLVFNLGAILQLEGLTRCIDELIMQVQSLLILILGL